MKIFQKRNIVYRNSEIGVLRKFITSMMYVVLAKLQQFDFLQLKCMNLGYSGPTDLVLKKEDELEKLQFQLYHHITQKLDFVSKNVLEVGCGTGGGCYFMSTYLSPQKIVGIDLIKDNLAIAKARFPIEQIHFQQADACSFEFKNERFDSIVNLESSHCYPDIPSFLSCVFEALKENGHFTFADIRRTSCVAELEKQFIEAGFEMVHKENITQGVVKSLAEDNERKKKQLDNNWITRKLYHNFAVMKGSDMYTAFGDGSCQYVHYILKKPSTKLI